MFRLSIAAYPDNPFVEHAFAQELFVHAIDYADDAILANNLAKEAEGILLRLHALPQEGVDYYPLLTLYTLRTKYLLKNDLGKEARRAAREYFEQLTQLAERHPNNKDIAAGRASALKLASTGVWEPPTFSRQIDED